ncbi:hypothetical protein [Trichocoleus sp. FACHB-46]|uniref:Uncharacterized protein n=1 Tax=Trichocoleus desertorum GB2-A4 TaxID=2933944 RepID=A0ABV0J7J9_9CYAN|nr:hypothetical protein [Trichocoleus sp. FACHB-46]
MSTANLSNGSDANQSTNQGALSSNSVPGPGNAASTTLNLGTAAPANLVASPTSSPIPQIQPGQFVQPALDTKAKVELLTVKRIKDPETSVNGPNARNPDTSETYEAVSLDRSTGSISLFQLRPSASADACVWLRIPEGGNAIDIFIPKTVAFDNVPTAN